MTQMFPLQTSSFPPDAAALREALEQSLSKLLRPADGAMVTVEDKNYPELAAIRMSLDGAETGDRPPVRPTAPVGAIEPGLQVADLAINARPLLIQQARVELSCTAHEVRLGQGRDKAGNVLLLLQDATDGQIEVAIALADLEALVLAAVRTEADKQGVTVESVRIELTARSERALDVVVHVRAKKLFLTASVRIIGSGTIDEQLNARLAGLQCDSEGTLGTLACGFIAPHLARFDGREVSLLALPLGEVKLRDVRIAAGRELRVTAQFGHAA